MFSVLLLDLLEISFLEWKYYIETISWNNWNINIDIVQAQIFYFSEISLLPLLS